MAVFTSLTQDDLESWLADCDIGPLQDFHGIAAGIENSNFFVTTSHATFVLTIFERLGAAELPFYLELMRHLAARGVACPAPLPRRDGSLFAPLKGKPAALVTKLPGHWVRAPSLGQCATAGAAMARMHVAGADFAIRQPNLRGLDWWRVTVPRIVGHLDDARRALLLDELAFQERHLADLGGTLPEGPIHADLFRDNVLFEGERLGGFIDFYFAGWDSWLFDVAVSLNDWCLAGSDGTLDGRRAAAFLGAYAEVRPFLDAERAALPTLLRAAALRFWLSRLSDLHEPRPASLLTPHDPVHFERILRTRRDQAAQVPTLPH